MLAHWRREAKVQDPPTQREMKRVLRLMRAFARLHPVHKARLTPMLAAFRAELTTMVIARTHGHVVAAAYNIQHKSQKSGGCVDQRSLDKALKRSKLYEPAKNDHAGKPGPPRRRGRQGDPGPAKRGPRRERDPKPRYQRQDPAPTAGQGGRRPPGTVAHPGPGVCFKCKESGHKIADCPKP